MIYFALDQMAKSGIDNVLIVTGREHGDQFSRTLGDGHTFGLRHLDYAYQDRPTGIAGALGLAEAFAGGQPIAVLLGDNIFEYSISPIIGRFTSQPRGARILLP